MKLASIDCGSQGSGHLDWYTRRHNDRSVVLLGSTFERPNQPPRFIELPLDPINPPATRTDLGFNEYVTNAKLISRQDLRLTTDTDQTPGLMILIRDILGANHRHSGAHFVVEAETHKIQRQVHGIPVQFELDHTDQIWHFSQEGQILELYAGQIDHSETLYLSWFGNALQLWEESNFLLFRKAQRYQPDLAQQLLDNPKISMLCQVEF